jgi:exonuclease III
MFMKHKIISWNVRGLNERDKRLRINNLLGLWKVDIVCFQETKMESILNSFVQSLWGCPYVDWCRGFSRSFGWHSYYVGS